MRITGKTTATLLACALAATVYVGFECWGYREADVQQQLVLTPEGSVPLWPPETVGVPEPQGLDAHDYGDIAAHNLFSQDRNPAVVVDPPAPKPMPAPRLPVVFGVVSLGSGVHAFMAESLGGTQKAVGVHDVIGEFTVIALDSERIILAWRGDNLAYKIADLMYNASRTDKLPVSPPSTDRGHVMAVAELGTRSSPSGVDGSLGPEVGAPGASRHECVSDDPSPSGSIIGRYRKLIVQNPFGVGCSWVIAHGPY